MAVSLPFVKAIFSANCSGTNNCTETPYTWTTTHVRCLVLQLHSVLYLSNGIFMTLIHDLFLFLQAFELLKGFLNSFGQQFAIFLVLMLLQHQQKQNKRCACVLEALRHRVVPFPIVDLRRNVITNESTAVALLQIFYSNEDSCLDASLHFLSKMALHCLTILQNMTQP